MPEFRFDYRSTNPKLHHLYVGYALETLQTVQECIEALDSHSRVHSSLFLGKLVEQRREFCAEDAAYFEAAALLYSGADLTPWTNPDPLTVDDVVDQPRYVGKGELPPPGWIGDAGKLVRRPDGEQVLPPKRPRRAPEGSRTGRVAGPPLPEGESHGGAQAARNAGKVARHAGAAREGAESFRAGLEAQAAREVPEARRRRTRREIAPEPAPAPPAAPSTRPVRHRPVGGTSLISGKPRRRGRGSSTGKKDS